MGDPAVQVFSTKPPQPVVLASSFWRNPQISQSNPHQNLNLSPLSANHNIHYISKHIITKNHKNSRTQKNWTIVENFSRFFSLPLWYPYWRSTQNVLNITFTMLREFRELIFVHKRPRNFFSFFSYLLCFSYPRLPFRVSTQNFVKAKAWIFVMCFTFHRFRS